MMHVHIPQSTTHIHTHPSPATGNINVLLFPAQCRLRVTVDLTPELHALVN